MPRSVQLVKSQFPLLVNTIEYLLSLIKSHVHYKENKSIGWLHLDLFFLPSAKMYRALPDRAARVCLPSWDCVLAAGPDFFAWNLSLVFRLALSPCIQNVNFNLVPKILLSRLNSDLPMPCSENKHQDDSCCARQGASLCDVRDEVAAYTGWIAEACTSLPSWNTLHFCSWLLCLVLVLEAAGIFQTLKNPQYTWAVMSPDFQFPTWEELGPLLAVKSVSLL